MGRAPCREKSGLKKGTWTPEEDEKLVAYITKHGDGNWSTLPKNAGLARTGKSCRLRWTNYLRPGIKRGGFSLTEEDTIIALHSIIGNKWSTIATYLPGRTNSEIKNYWNTHLRKRLLRDPVTHAPLPLLDLPPVTHAPLPLLDLPSFTHAPLPLLDIPPVTDAALLDLLDQYVYDIDLSLLDIHNLEGGSFSSYLEVEGTGSIVSSSSGTIVSTAYTSSVSRPSTSISMEAAMHFVSLEIDEDVNGNNVQICEEAEDEEAENEETEEEHIRRLVQEFFSPPSAYYGLKAGDISVVERWLKKLGVGWVLRLHDDGTSAAAGEEKFDRDARTWIRALDHIVQTFCSMMPLFPHPGSVLREEKHVGVGERPVPDRYHLALFIQQTMSKILKFVDVIVACDPDMTEEFLSMDQVMPPPYNKLIALQGVHDALSKVSYKILTQISWTNSEKGRRIERGMFSLVSECTRIKLGKAISSTIEKIRIMYMQDGDDSSSPLNPRGSSDIHKVTRSVMTYFEFLNSRSRLVNQVMQDHFRQKKIMQGHCTENIRPLDNMIAEMLPSLQEKLVNISESFSDQGLKLLFLLNNSNEIQWRLESYDLRGPELLDVEHKIEGYMERYIQVSWAPLLSCLCNSTPLCLGKNNSLLSKFESEFQKIYSTQKQWKVPDPELRRRLRKLITDKIIPGYTEYIEEHKVTNPKFSPQELKAMLQELFEG